MPDMSELTFETAFAQLEDAVRSLEAGELPLEEALALFERGVQLANACNVKLDAAELRVKQLVPQADGTYEAEPWDVPE
jgi:exodeoxyribonuclease VII small subunit